MTEDFNTYIRDIEFSFWRDLCVKEGELRSFSKGEAFVSRGKPGKYIGFIKSGTLKYVAYSDDGVEHVTGLAANDCFVADWPFCLHEIPAGLSIVADSDCEIYCIPSSMVAEKMKHESNVRYEVMRATEAVFSMLYNRHIDFYTTTPQERYNELISKNPDIFELFSLKDIASYLNISPTHLSRLRKNI